MQSPRLFRWRTVVLVIACSALMLQTGTATARASADCPAGATLNVVAHPDDDLLFQSPDIIHDIAAGKCVRTVYLTAGERAHDAQHIQSRERGVRAAYAQMAGVTNNWTAGDAGIPGHPVALYTLTARPSVSLVFFRLPEGIWGEGDSPALETPQNLWLGNVSRVTAEDGSSTYTKQELIAALTTLMNALQADTIRTQDYVGAFDDGDHDDHHATAYFAHSAHLAYATQHTFIGYLDYATEGKPENVFGSDLTTKTNAFYTYLGFDSAPCGAPPDCGTNEYAHWLGRQYIVGKEPDDSSVDNTNPISTISSPTANQTVCGSVDVAATVRDQSGSGIWLTAFRLDSASADPSAVDYSSPWGFSLDTTRLADGRHTLYVRGADYAGNVGHDAAVDFTIDNTSGACVPTGAGTGGGGGGGTGGDTGGGSTGPITTFTSPTANQTVCGSVEVGATAQDQSGAGVWLTAFRVDSASADPSAVDYSSPWGFSLDTTRLADGRHTLYVRAADNTGDVGHDATVAFTVDNASGACGPPPPPHDGSPITTLASPVDGQTVSGTIDVTATVEDQSGAGIWLSAFRLDSASADPSAVDYDSPWGFTLDTTQLSNGPHTLLVRSEDNVLNISPDASVTIYVNN